MTMRIVDFAKLPDEEWRAGVMTRMRVSAINCAAELCVFEQWCAPDKGAPTHVHTVEEVLSVLEGQAEIWVEEERAAVSAGQSVVIAAGRRHGFRNIGITTLHVQAILAAPIFEATFEGQSELTRRWLPERRATGA
jgi:mannose-6-phosphate isomerase-like protein (cupin superfamily)